MTTRQQALQDLDNHFASIVETFDRRFDTHEFILRLAQQQQRGYIRALAAYEDAAHPFMSLHGELGRRLLGREDLVEKVGNQESPDIFGQVNEAVVWQKRTY